MGVGGRGGIGVVDVGEERLRSRVHRDRRHRRGPAPPRGREARDCTVRRHTASGSLLPARARGAWPADSGPFGLAGDASAALRRLSGDAADAGAPRGLLGDAAGPEASRCLTGDAAAEAAALCLAGDAAVAAASVAAAASANPPSTGPSAFGLRLPIVILARAASEAAARPGPRVWPLPPSFLDAFSKSVLTRDNQISAAATSINFSADT